MLIWKRKKLNAWVRRYPYLIVIHLGMRLRQQGRQNGKAEFAHVSFRPRGSTEIVSETAVQCTKKRLAMPRITDSPDAKKKAFVTTCT